MDPNLNQDDYLKCEPDYNNPVVAVIAMFEAAWRSILGLLLHSIVLIVNFAFVIFSIWALAVSLWFVFKPRHANAESISRSISSNCTFRQICEYEPGSKIPVFCRYESVRDVYFAEGKETLPCVE